MSNPVQYAVASPFNTVDTVQLNPLGMTCQGDNGDEYIYLAGAASTIAGSWVTYGVPTFVSTLTPTSAWTAGPVAVAMAAILAADWGWYQIKGVNAVCNIATATVATGSALYVSASAGRASTSAEAAQAIFGAFTAAANPAANVGTAYLRYPFIMASSTL